MSEFDRSSIPHDIAADFANATMADFMTGSSEGTQVVERQAESLWLEAAMLPEGETRLDEKTVVVMEDGALTIRTNSQALDPVLRQEFTISKQGDNTTITKNWSVCVRATATHPAYVKSESISLVTGAEDDPSIPEDAPSATQADLKSISDSLDKWHSAIIEVKSRQESQATADVARSAQESAVQRWLSKIVRISRLGH
jgi:hypothetical protein